ncbi:hypothetical protein SOVF_058270 [Spinacia oleracea]|nr:hypothetical protein SOVF_058270 [Spinacia oleracea]
MASHNLVFCLILISSLLVIISEGQSTVPVVPGLSYSFYYSSCPELEIIVRSHLWEVFNNDITQAAGLLRLHFHDCFVQDAPPNLTLRSAAFTIIDDLRALVHGACGSIVSCADIVALAARESVFLPNGPYYSIPLGRRDSVNFATRPVTLANLPPPTFNTTSLINAFAAKNLTTTDLVALSGGHTIGRGHCTSFADRLYPTQDPTMDQTFVKNLKLTCPTNTTNNSTNLDIRSPNLFDNKYYVDLMNRQGLFTSDQDLYTDSRTRNIVLDFSINQNLFFEKFVEGMLKMGQLGVLTGTQGEIRTNCSARNGNNVDLASVVGEHQEQEMLSQY